MERAEEEVAGAIAREDAAGAVRAVRRRREPHDHDAGERVAEPGDGLAPVVVTLEAGALVAGDCLPPIDEPRAGAAAGDLHGKRAQRAGVRRRHGGGSYAAAPMRLLLMVNATASSVTPRRRVLVRKALAAHHDVETAQTTRRGHATKLARAAANDGFDAVVVLAGDGTLNEAADGLVGTQCALGALPGGSTNVYAQTLRTPRDVVAAADLLARSLSEGRTRRIGVGNAVESAGGHTGGRRFLFHAGFGFDATVIRRVERHGELKRFAAHPLYVGAAFATFFRHFDRRSPGFDIVLDDSGERIDGVFFAIVSKTTPYTFLGPRPLHVAPHAGLDRALALTAFTRVDVVTLLGGAASAMATGRFLGRRDGVVHRHDLCSLQVAGRRPFAWQVDGDDVGDTPALTVRYEPACLTVLLP